MKLSRLAAAVLWIITVLHTSPVIGGGTNRYTKLFAVGTTNRWTTVTNPGVKIIDLHMHAWYPADWEDSFPRAQFEPLMGHQCTNLEEELTLTIKGMDAFGIEKGLLQGENELTLDWVKRYPGRFIQRVTE